MNIKFLRLNIGIILNLYESSWELYKEHSSIFVDDLPYYLELTRGHSTLEMFAGYGRIANFLNKQGVDVETVELSPEFSDCIELPQQKRHVADVTKFRLGRQFARIIAGYNSICLLTEAAAQIAFFSNVAAMLETGGLVSLSYYHPDAWAGATGHDFTFKGEVIRYVPTYELGKRAEKQGTWVDTYRFSDQELTFKYPVRIFETAADFAPFLLDTGLRLIDKIMNYNNPNISDPGWQEYLFEKS